MDLFTLIFGIFVLFLIIVILYRRVFVTAGQVGEKAVARRLRWLPKKEYFIINDLLFKRKNGHTTQIDHVVVSPYGIFVIETKNISGYVYGSEYSKTWTRHWQGFTRGGHYTTNELSFDNPVLQNGAHVKALYDELKQYHVKFVPIVAFSPEAELKISVQGVDVVYWSQIVEVIKRYKEPTISIEQAREIFNLLQSINIIDKKSRRQHVIDARNNKTSYNQNTPPSSPITYRHGPLKGKESAETWAELNRMYNNQ